MIWSTQFDSLYPNIEDVSKLIAYYSRRDLAASSSNLGGELAIPAHVSVIFLIPFPLFTEVHILLSVCLQL
jgi:hypothetical protein